MAVLIPDKVNKFNDLVVKSYLLTDHNVNKISMPGPRTKALKGITIHNTDVIKVSGTTMAEQYTRATVNGNMNTVRVHFYVDNVEAWQNLPLEYTSWHAADGSGDGNTATISIECIMGAAGYEKSEDNAARLTAYLLDKYGLGIENVFTHTYWLNVRDGLYPNMSKDDKCCKKHAYKTCPAYIIPHWAAFLDKVKSYMKPKASEALYRVQLGAFREKKNAEAMLADVKKHYPDAYISCK